MTDSNVLGIIPARGQSKRLPRKNLCLLGGKPLLGWALDAARQARRLNRLIVSSDDDEILALARELRPAFAAQASARVGGRRFAGDRLCAARVGDAGAGRKRQFDVVVILQATSPFTLPEDIDATIDLLPVERRRHGGVGDACRSRGPSGQAQDDVGRSAAPLLGRRAGTDGRRRFARGVCAKLLGLCHTAGGGRKRSDHR